MTSATNSQPAMTKTVISGFITYEQTVYSNEPDISFTLYDPRESSALQRRVVIREHSFEIETPANFDPRPSVIANLRAAATQARAEFEKRITEINREISNLQAIEYTA